MSSYINTKEIPSGVINGINKDFITLDTSSSFLSIFVDGAETTLFTYNSGTKTISFTNAPLYEVYVTYIVGSGTVLSTGQILLTNASLTGIVNGTNTIFTTTENIQQIVSLVVDGTEMFDFSFTPGTKTITLGFAPETSVGPLDYTTYGNTAGNNSFANNGSQGDIINIIYNEILHEKTTSTVYGLPACKRIINEVQDAICTGGYTDLNGLKHKAPNLSFLEKKGFFDFFITYNVFEDATAGSTSIKCNNALANSGYIMINNNIMSYSGNDGTTIIGLQLLQNNVKRGDIVYFLTKLGSDNFKNIKVSVNNSNGERILDPFDSRDEVNQSIPGYFIMSDFYNDKYILITGNFNAGDVVSYEYHIVAPDITSNINSILPGKFSLSIIPYLVASRMLVGGDEIKKAQVTERQGLNELNRLYSVFASKSGKFRNIIRSKPLRVIY